MTRYKATYDDTLPNDLDWVRLNIGDRDVDDPTFSDEEITATLAGEKNKWLAAAALGELMLAQRRGAVSRSVEDLSISYGDSPDSAYRSHVRRLRVRGCKELLGRSGGTVLRGI